MLVPGHTVLWLPPHFIRVHSCPFFLQATSSSGSLHISFEFTHVHSFSRPHRPLAHPTSHSSSLMSITRNASGMLAPGHIVLWLTPHLIRVHSCPLQGTRLACLLQATSSSGSLHISFEFTHVHYKERVWHACSRPHQDHGIFTSCNIHRQSFHIVVLLVACYQFQDVAVARHFTIQTLIVQRIYC